MRVYIVTYMVYTILDEYDQQVADQMRMMVTDGSISSIQLDTRLSDAELERHVYATVYANELYKPLRDVLGPYTPEADRGREIARSIVATTYNNAPEVARIFRAFTFVVELFTAPQDSLAVRA